MYTSSCYKLGEIQSNQQTKFETTLSNSYNQPNHHTINV